MSDSNVQPARPVSLFTIVFVFAVFAAFLLVIRWGYTPATTSTFNAAPDNLPKELQWRATAESRRKTLEEHRAAEQKKATSYGWVDQNAKTVQLPLERAMELTASELAAKQSGGARRNP